MTKRELVSWALVAGLAASGGAGWWKAAQVAAPLVGEQRQWQSGIEWWGTGRPPRELPLPGGQASPTPQEHENYLALVRKIGDVGAALNHCEARLRYRDQLAALDRQWRQRLLEAGLFPRTEAVR